MARRARRRRIGWSLGWDWRGARGRLLRGLGDGTDMAAATESRNPDRREKRRDDGGNTEQQDREAAARNEHQSSDRRVVTWCEVGLTLDAA